MTADKNQSHFSRYLKSYIFLLLVIVLGAGSWGYAKLHNEMAELEQRAATQWQQVNVQLVRQSELIPKLVDVAKAYAAHEEGVLSNISDARKQYLASSALEQPGAASKLDQAMSGALLLAESYPDLKADESFRDLSYELAGTKNRIAVERMRYNEIVGIFNTRLNQFPWRLASSGKSPLVYYSPPEDLLSEPNWKLD